MRDTNTYSAFCRSKYALAAARRDFSILESGLRPFFVAIGALSPMVLPVTPWSMHGPLLNNQVPSIKAIIENKRQIAHYYCKVFIKINTRKCPNNQDQKVYLFLQITSNKKGPCQRQGPTQTSLSIEQID
jgi:hypothetical protein